MDTSIFNYRVWHCFTFMQVSLSFCNAELCMTVVLILYFKVFKCVYLFLFPPILLRCMCGYICLVYLCMHESVEVDASFMKLVSLKFLVNH